MSDAHGNGHTSASHPTAVFSRPTSFVRTVQADLHANVPEAHGLYGWAWSLAFSQGFQAVLLHRAAHYLVSRGGGFKFLARVIVSSSAKMFGVYIDPEVPIGPGLAMPHPVGIVMAWERPSASARPSIRT